LADVVADGLPTYLVTHQLQVKRRTEKVRRSQTDVLSLCHATNTKVTFEKASNRRRMTLKVAQGPWKWRYSI